MKIYIAGSSKEIERAENAMRAASLKGHVITFNWCAAMRAEPQADHALSHEEHARYANDDATGVVRCDLLWLLAPHDGKSEGAFWEMGYAYGLGKSIVVSGPCAGRIFCYLPGIRRFASDIMALACV